MRNCAASLAACVFVLVLGACGGSKHAALSAADYRTQVDAICAQAGDALGALAAPTSTAELRAYVRQAKPLLDDLVSRAEKITPPPTLAASAKRWIAQNRKALAIYGTLEHVKESEIHQRDLTFQNESRLASTIAGNDLGLKTCAGK